MPTYEFRCPQGHEFEHFYRKISDAAAELPCPECGAVATRKLSGGAGLLFKGSGFYLTDYGKNAHAKRGDAKAGAASEGGKAEAGTGEAKPREKDAGGATAEPAGAKPDAKAESKGPPKPAAKKSGEG